MTMRNKLVRGQSGFTLIDALVALAVLSFGLLAVAHFQSQMVSGSSYSKARNVAVSLAQQKLDELRNYTSAPELVANLSDAAINTADTFPNSLADGTYPAVAENIERGNAQYTRNWTVQCTADLCDVAVTVSWTDPKSGLESVSLNTMVTWRNPRSSADLGLEDIEPLVPNATGRAYLGEGDYKATGIPDGATDMGDGTSTYANGDDLELIDNETLNVVLTLQDACVTGYCTGFVEIAGRVYLDGSSRMSLNDIYVLASDAAYCALVTTDDAGAPLVANSMQYMEYTCYLGGGWHGNIGLLFGGNANSSDLACVGDPTASNSDSSDAWKRVELAKRRVYRGMSYKYETIYDWGWLRITKPIFDANNDIIYYSVGIGDAVKLPDPSFRPGGHDFLVVRINGQATAADCQSALQSAGVFADVPGDFICLNRDRYPQRGWRLTAGDRFVRFLESGYVYLDTMDRTQYMAFRDCPYDPSDPPASRHAISGTVTSNSIDLTELEIETSDGEGNCELSLTSGDTAVDYSCNVYDWGSGWDGSILVYAPTGITCTPATLTYAGVTGDDSSGNDAYCVGLAEHVIEGTLTASFSDLYGLSLQTSDGQTCTTLVSADGASAAYSCSVYEDGTGWNGTVTANPAQGVTCTPGTWTYNALVEDATVANGYATGSSCSGAAVLNAHAISGSVSAPSLDLTGLMVSTSDGTGCSVTLAGTGDMADYSCTVYEDGTGWNGTVSMVAPAGITCNPPNWGFTSLTANSAGNDSSCTGGSVWVSHAITGTVSAPGESLTGLGVSASDASSCTLSMAVDAQSATYACTVSEDGSGWSGTISLTNLPNGVTCDVASWPYSGLTSDAAGDASCTGVATFAKVVVSGSIATYNASQSDVDGITISPSGSCVTNVPLPGDPTTYTCTTGDLADDGTLYNVSVTVSSNKTACESPLSFSVTAGTTLSNKNVNIAKNPQFCP